jgi:UDP-3-O-[3-hydroxymyristoyl] glucosamine N-acyltransferase
MAGIGLAEPVRLADLAERYGGRVDEGAQDRLIFAIAPIGDATDRDLAPLLGLYELSRAASTPAALLVDATVEDRCPGGRRWVTERASWVLSCLLSEVVAIDRAGPPLIDPSARIGPGAVILDGALVGAGTIIEPGAVVYGRVRIGARVVIGAGAVIGRPGFGWAEGPSSQRRRIPQLGGVVVEDDVEIGPLSTVDAGTLSPTRIRRGAKLDAQVHVGHNAEIGPGVIVAAQSGFAGSVHIGEGTLVGGQVGVADHVSVGSGARLAAKSGVIGDVRAGAVVMGYPAVDRMRWLRAMARLLRRSGKVK